MEDTLFTKKDSGFICSACGHKVPPLGYSSRNHCPFCLCSQHEDLQPGDRASECHGIMRPVRVEPDGKKGFVITHECEKCGMQRKNRSARDDDTDLLIRLTNPYNIPERKHP